MAEKNVGAGKGSVLTEVADILGTEDVVKGLSRRLKLSGFDAIFGKNWWKGLFAVIQNADYSKDSPVSPRGVIDVINDYMYRCVDISTVVGEEIGSESIMEMLSEGLSSALETNFNGSLQTILNVWKGSLPPDMNVVMQIGQRIDRVSRYYALSQIAPVGQLPYTILEILTSTADLRLKEKYSTIIGSYQSILNDKNALMLSVLAELRSFVADLIANLVYDVTLFIERIENYVINVCQEHLSRVNQLLDNLEANQKMYEYDLIDNEEYTVRMLEIDAQAEGTDAVFDEFMSVVNTLIAEYTNVLDSIKDDIIAVIMNYLSDAENEYNTLINAIVNSISSLNYESNMKSLISTIYEDLRAYRQSGFNYV